MVSLGAIGRAHSNWTDYGSIKETFYTRQLLDEAHPERDLRRRFHKEIIDKVKLSLVEAPQEERICIFTCGGTASGKTSLVNTVLKNNADLLVGNIIRIDYDRLKQSLPEYKYLRSLRMKEAASIVHAESAKLADTIFNAARKGKSKVIMEGSLKNPEPTLHNIQQLKRRGYEIVVLATHIELELGLSRARVRAQKRGRYVPEEEITSTYQEVPKSLCRVKPYVYLIHLFDNNTKALKKTYSFEAGQDVIVNREGYQAYLNSVGESCDLTKV